MATVNAVNSKSKGGGGLRGSLRYISQDKKAMLKDGRRLVSGVNCSPDVAYTEFMTTKKLHSKTNGRQFYHFVQSFHPDEAVTPEQVHRIGLELAERRFPGFEVVVATHMDTEHLHSHLIVNSVSYETGKKLHQSAEDLRQHRAVSDEICLAHGLTILPTAPESSGTKSLRPREYRAAVRTDSWKFRLMNAIEHCMSQSRSRREFIESMKRLDYGVSWSDSRKYITYTCPNGMKCRDNRLHEAKYLKESMQLEFQYRAVERAEPAGVTQAGQAVSTGGLRYPTGAVGVHGELAQEQSAPPAGDSRGNTEQRQRMESERESPGSPEYTGGSIETGWEQSRQDLEGFEGTGIVRSEEAVGASPVNPAMALNGLSLAGDLAGLARNLGEMIEEPPRPAKPKSVHERKRAIGQKRDDHEQEYELTM